MTQFERWQISGNGPDNYERYAVGRYLGALAQTFVEQMRTTPGSNVLDVACGTGIVARLAARCVVPRGRVAGLDLNPAMLAVAQRLSHEAGLEIAWRQGDVTKMPFADAAFDRVLCQQGLQFFPDKLGALREMRRVLARGGRLGLNVSGAPNRFQVLLAEGLAKFANEAVAKVSLAPFAMTDRAALPALLAEAGFTQITAHTQTLERRFEPTQEWLLQYSSALPYAEAVARIPAMERAQMLREIARGLKAYWRGDCFVVPWEVHFAFARS